MRFLTDPDALGRARRIALGPTEFSVSGDMSLIDVLVPFGAVSGKIRVTNGFRRRDQRLVPRPLGQSRLAHCALRGRAAGDLEPAGAISIVLEPDFVAA